MIKGNCGEIGLEISAKTSKLSVQDLKIVNSCNLIVQAYTSSSSEKFDESINKSCEEWLVQLLVQFKYAQLVLIINVQR